MAKKQPAKGQFNMKNPQKYFGGSPDKVTYRSSWEWTMMNEFDTNPDILGWSSETCSIPYFNPLANRQTVYVPDFVIVYVDRKGNKIAEMIEVKPAKEVPGYLSEGKISKKDRLSQALNECKWAAARAFCAKRKIRFRVMTEYEIYGAYDKSRKRKK